MNVKELAVQKLPADTTQCVEENTHTHIDNDLKANAHRVSRAQHLNVD